MRTIEERAEALASGVIDSRSMLNALFHNTIRDCCVEIAEEQRQIDTELLLSLLDKAIEEWNGTDRHQGCRIDKEGALRRFRKAMEKQQPAKADRDPVPRYTTEQILHDFIQPIASEAQPLDGDVSEFVEENFWNLVQQEENK